MFVNPAELLKDPDEVKNPFNVSDPSRAEGASHIVYTVRGVIEGAEFECKRRYKEFHLMRNALANRWPGVYIPCVPPKKAMGNMEEPFLQERRHFLDKFIKQIGRYGFLQGSEEFKTFAHEQNCKQRLPLMPNLAPSEILSKYRDKIKIEERKNSVEVSQCKEVIREFVVWSKKVMAFLDAFKR